jgi:hypothetical protein
VQVRASRGELRGLPDAAGSTSRIAVSGVDEEVRGVDVDAIRALLRGDPGEKATTTVD